MNFDLALLPKKYNSRIEVEWLSVAVCLFEHFMAVCTTYSWRKTEKTTHMKYKNIYIKLTKLEQQQSRERNNFSTLES